MHDHVLADREVREKNPVDVSTEKHQELFMSHIILNAIQLNMHIDTVLFPNGNCIDIGTPEDMLNVLKLTI